MYLLQNWIEVAEVLEMKKFLVALAALLPLVATASGTTSTTYWWSTKNGVDGRTNGYRDLTVNNTNAGIGLNITGWSDHNPATDPADSQTNKEQYDQTVGQAHIYHWGDRKKVGVVNSDENPNANGDHAIDNGTTNNPYWADQDMVLLSFTSSVVLEGLKVSWQQIGTDGALNIGAIEVNQSQVDDMKSGTKTWSDIFDSSQMLNISNYKQDTQYYSLSNTSDRASSMWLVGFYSEGGSDYDAFKLMGLKGTQMVTAVSEPGVLALFALGLMLIGRRKFSA